MARGRYGHMIKSLIVIGDFFCLNIAYAVVCYWGGGFDGGFGVKIIISRYFHFLQKYMNCVFYMSIES